MFQCLIAGDICRRVTLTNIRHQAVKWKGQYVGMPVGNTTPNELY